MLKQLPAQHVERVILRLVDLREYKGDRAQLSLDVRSMNDILAMDDLGVNFSNSRPILVGAEALELDVDELTRSPQGSDETSFLGRQFPERTNIDELSLDPVISQFLQARVDEAQACPRDTTPLATIFLLGSTFEGLLIAIATKDQAPFMRATAAPKDKAGTVVKIYDWKLAELINVATELGMLNLDVKKFSHELRDFRNYVHPYHQMSQRFAPDPHTVDI